ncbi:GNAT family N-acetyltransferase [Vibrio sp. M250220]|uniref:GNAT family N-acetyltransferase n=1 Tax=Vibrio sp. M250220 TaxID=3020894 RepID=UPI002F422C70
MESVNIRDVEQKDISDVQKYISEPSLSDMSNIPSPYPENGAEIWFNHVQSLISENRARIFVIELGKEFAGVIAMNALSLHESKANFDYWVRLDLQGEGIASKALGFAVEEAKRMGLKTLYSGCLVRNVASQRVLKNNGFSPYRVIKLADGKHVGEELVQMSKTST